MRITASDIADIVADGLKEQLDRIDQEQAVYGLDACGEIELHSLLAAVLHDGGFGVHREVRYPSHRTHRRISTGERCDIVLTAGGRSLAPEASRGTLFDPPDAVSLSEAYWLEVKVVSQFTIEGPNPNYASQLLSPVRRDISKLATDNVILHAGLLLILFVRDESVADHDLAIWQGRCIERGLAIGIPSRRTISMTDRHGNGVCVVAVYPIPRV